MFWFRNRRCEIQSCWFTLCYFCCKSAIAVGAFQLSFVSDGGAFGDLHLHISEDAVPHPPRTENWVFSSLSLTYTHTHYARIPMYVRCKIQSLLPGIASSSLFFSNMMFLTILLLLWALWLMAEVWFYVSIKNLKGETIICRWFMRLTHVN